MGCASHSRRPRVTLSTAALNTATLQDLVGRVNSSSALINTLNATVDIQASTGGARVGKITEYQEIRGYILARKPGWLRMVGLFPVLRNRAFDMVSDGFRFKLSIPSKNRFIVGSNEIAQPSQQPLENLRPQHIYDSLLLRPIDPESDIAVLEQENRTITIPNSKTTVVQPEYVLDIVSRGVKGWFLSRKLYFSRTDLEPYRQVVFDQNGSIATDARYEDFQNYEGVEFPSHIRIRRPQEQYSVDLSILKLTANSALTDEQFVLNQPPGAEVVQLESGGTNRASAPPSGQAQ
jgi:hypothetical protein